MSGIISLKNVKHREVRLATSMAQRIVTAWEHRAANEANSDNNVKKLQSNITIQVHPTCNLLPQMVN